jgi:putative colanic acid biosynthesis acetyltransferase WcaF
MSFDSIDVAANRAQRSYVLSELVARLLWGIGATMFWLVPRPLYGVRRTILRVFGATVGPHVHIHPTARIFMPWNLVVGEYSAIGDRAIIYNLGPIRIGARTTISQNAHLCAGSHDYRDPAFRLLRTPITIGDDAWICADAFVGPGVTVGDHAIVAARAVAVRDVAPGLIIAGNPAKVIKRRDSPHEAV